MKNDIKKSKKVNANLLNLILWWYSLVPSKGH